MFGRRRKPSVLAEISGPTQEGTRAWSLRRDDLDAFNGLLEKLRDTQVLLIGGEEGRLAVATGLATAAGAGGRRAVLVECDLAKPRLAGALGLSPVPGLHEYLRWDATAPQILQQAVLAGPESGGATSPLACIAAGEATTDGATLLSSESFVHAIAKLRNAYDLVVLGGPPLDRDEASLAAVAARADSTVACVARPSTSGKPAKELKATLRRLHLSVDGLVVVD
jgi:Mrp family chromosome partitioning ATPase